MYIYVTLYNYIISIHWLNLKQLIPSCKHADVEDPPFVDHVSSTSPWVTSFYTKWCPSSQKLVKLVYKPGQLDIFTPQTLIIGVLFTNLANYHMVTY